MGERMELINRNQIAAIHALLNRLDLMEEKKDIVRMFSNDRTDSTKDLTRTEARRLIAHLNGMVTPTEEEKATERMRNKVLGIAHDLKWELPNGKVDMSRLNTWCMKSSYLKKPFNKYSYAELPRLITQIEKVYNWNTRE